MDKEQLKIKMQFLGKKCYKKLLRGLKKCMLLWFCTDNSAAVGFLPLIAPRLLLLAKFISKLLNSVTVLQTLGQIT